jgi:hypothetical protein
MSPPVVEQPTKQQLQRPPEAHLTAQSQGYDKHRKGQTGRKQHIQCGISLVKGAAKPAADSIAD